MFGSLTNEWMSNLSWFKNVIIPDGKNEKVVFKYQKKFKIGLIKAIPS